MKEKVLNLYKRLLKVIESDNVAEIVDYFKKFNDYTSQKFQEEKLDGKLFTVLQLCSICHVVEALGKLNVNYKSLTQRWNFEAVQHCYELNKKLNQLNRFGEKDGDQYKILFYQFFKLINKQEDAAVQLYMHQVYKNSPDGADFYLSELEREKKLLQCKSEEEIDAVLNEETPKLSNEKLKVQEQCVKTSIDKVSSPSDSVSTHELHDCPPKQKDALKTSGNPSVQEHALQEQSLSDEEIQQEFERLKEKYFNEIDEAVSKGVSYEEWKHTLARIDEETKTCNKTVKHRLINVIKMKLERDKFKLL